MVVRSDAQGGTAAVDSEQAQELRYEDVPYVLIYATVGNILCFSWTRKPMFVMSA